MNEELKAALKVVAERVAVDGDFRAKYEVDPLGAIREATGLVLPPGTEVELPSLADEITEEELNGVAGGWANPFPTMNFAQCPIKP